ncbi:MAG: hypothetical protein WB709_03900 [Solirubrobacteraceae bacterium]
MSEPIGGMYIMPRVKLIFLGLLAVLAVSATATSSAMAHEWLENGQPITSTLQVLSSGGEFKLESSIVTLACKSVHDIGTVGPGAADEATSIHFLECITNKANCDVSSEGAPIGLILVTNIPTLLTLKETSLGVKVVADEFKENATRKNFVELLFTSLVAKACEPIPELATIKGIISAEAKNIAGGEVELNFPKPELKGNTLNLAGVASKLFGKDTQMLTNGNLLSAI